MDYLCCDCSVTTVVALGTKEKQCKNKTNIVTTIRHWYRCAVQKINYELRLKLLRICLFVYFGVLAGPAAFSGNWNTFLCCLPWAFSLFPVFRKLQTWARRQKYQFAAQMLVILPLAVPSIFMCIFVNSGATHAVAGTAAMIVLWGVAVFPEACINRR